MKPQTTAFLAKASELLERAPALLGQNFADEAGRAAYLAGFHAAQAFLFEATGRSPKTHNGVQTAFARLTKDTPSVDRDVRAFLSKTYNLKTIADYETGPGSKVTHQQAADAIEPESSGRALSEFLWQRRAETYMSSRRGCPARDPKTERQRGARRLARNTHQCA